MKQLDTSKAPRIPGICHEMHHAIIIIILFFVVNIYELISTNFLFSLIKIPFTEQLQKQSGIAITDGLLCIRLRKSSHTHP